MYFGGSFTYGDDFNSRNYKLEFAYMDTAEMVTPVSTKSYSTLKNQANQKRYIYDSNYAEPLTFEAEIFVNGSTITEEVSREICRKLFNSNEYKWLKLDYPEWNGIHLNCYMVLNEKIYKQTSLGYGVVGYKTTISCDAPFAWEDQDKIDMFLINRVTSSEDSKEITVNNPSDYERYTFPIMSVCCDAVSDNLDGLGLIGVEFKNGDDAKKILEQGFKIVSTVLTTSATVTLQTNDGTTYPLLSFNYSRSGSSPNFTVNITKIRQDNNNIIKCRELILPRSLYQSKVITFSNYVFKESSAASAENTVGDITAKIIIPNSVSSISASAFRGYPYREVEIPNTVKTIGNYAFQDSKLSIIYLPDSITSLGTYCFKGNTDLETAKLSNSLTTIGVQTFYGCSSLKTIDIPNSVTTIGGSTFYNCALLKTISLPNSLTKIETSLFYGCESLESIIIPEGVTTISSNAFYKCSSLNSITLPKSLISIASNAFYGCSSLKTVYYNGSQEEWSNNVTITTTNNSAIINAEKIYKE